MLQPRSIEASAHTGLPFAIVRNVLVTRRGSSGSTTHDRFPVSAVGPSMPYPINEYKRAFRVHGNRLLTCRPRKWAGGMKRTSLHTPEYTAVVALLRDLRLESGLSQAEAAAKVDRPQTWLSALEVGGRGLDLVQVRELAAVYGLDFPAFARRLEERLKDRPYRPPRRRRADAGTTKR